MFRFATLQIHGSKLDRFELRCSTWVWFAGAGHLEFWSIDGDQFELQRIVRFGHVDWLRIGW